MTDRRVIYWRNGKEAAGAFGTRQKPWRDLIELIAALLAIAAFIAVAIYTGV